MRVERLFGTFGFSETGRQPRGREKQASHYYTTQEGLDAFGEGEESAWRAAASTGREP
jgi:hypothetical protein